MSKKQPSNQPQPKFQFGAVADGPITEEEARDVVGPALLEIAERNKVKDVRSLTKKIIYDDVKKGGSKHPLYRFVFHCSQNEAAERYFIERCFLLVKSIEIIPLKLGPIHRTRAFVPASEVLQHSAGGGYTRRPAHVLRPDALSHDPEFNSVLAGRLKRFIVAFEQVEDWTSEREQLPEVAQLVVEVRASIDAFKKDSREAAE